MTSEHIAHGIHEVRGNGERHGYEQDVNDEREPACDEAAVHDRSRRGLRRSPQPPVNGRLGARIERHRPPPRSRGRVGAE